MGKEQSYLNSEIGMKNADGKVAASIVTKVVWMVESVGMVWIVGSMRLRPTEGERLKSADIICIC